MRESLATLAERRVPRYTSYPTAPHFNGSVDGATLTRWLAEIPPATPLSLYLHVPFCRQICWYCACNMKLVSREEPVLEYADWLGREIDLVAERLPAAMPVTAIHWGGGTPTAMPMAALSRITERLRARFRIAEDAETAFEIDPRSFEPGMAAGLAAHGANRA
ncbi:MAG TPA: radical SAM protein, partial [Paracoccaceae bacterium]|nr:radical SAM protein [Paracoccaceae bacterium]